MTVKERYQQKLSNGICGKCGKFPLATKSLCQRCRKELCERALRRSHSNKQKNLCQCGRRASLGRSRCDRCIEATKKCYRRLKCEIYAAYGGSICACCRETEPAFLTIDHINNDGAEHRRQVGMGWYFLRWLKTNNYPPGFQILCHNCQWGKRTYGMCPHQKSE